MTPHDFYQQAKECRNRFKQVWETVVKDLKVFEQKTIRPYQCDCARTSIQVLRDPIHELHLLLENIYILPLSVIPFRYDLLMALHSIKDIVDELSLLLIFFRRTCSSSSRDAMLYQQEIQRKLVELEHSNDTVQQSIDRMLLQTGSHKKTIQTIAR